MVRYTDFQSMIDDGIVPNLDMRPNCVSIMQQEFVEYVVGESLTHAYPVLEMFSNPRKSMQGGFICAAFDNTFGTMVILSTKQIETVTLDLNINYIKPIFINDKLIVKAHLKSQGRTIVHLIGEAYNQKEQLIATATTSFMLLNRR